MITSCGVGSYSFYNKKMYNFQVPAPNPIGLIVWPSIWFGLCFSPNMAEFASVILPTNMQQTPWCIKPSTLIENLSQIAIDRLEMKNPANIIEISMKGFARAIAVESLPPKQLFKW